MAEIAFYIAKNEGLYVFFPILLQELQNNSVFNAILFVNIVLKKN